MKLWLTLFATTALALAADPFVGTWKPDFTKWKLSPGAPEDRRKQTLTIEPGGKDTYRTTRAQDGKKGEPDSWELDGKERTGSGPGGAKMTSKSERLGEGHAKTTVTGPKGTMVMEWKVSADGKTMAITRKGNGTTSGRSLDEVLIYTKQ